MSDFLGKIKQGAKDAKENADLEAAYLKGKKSGYDHPPEVEEHIEIMRGMRDEIPKLRDRIGNFDSTYHSLAEYEEKISDDFLSFVDIPMQNPQISSIYRAFGEAKRQMATKRYNMQAVFNAIKEEWKPMESENLKDIKSKQDKANRVWSDLGYFKKKNKVAKCQELQMQYDMLSTELIDLIHILRVKKENELPGMLMRIAMAEAEFFTEAAQIAQAVESQMRNIGRVQVVPNTFGSMSNNYGQGPPPQIQQMQQQGPPPQIQQMQQQGPPPMVQRSQGPQVRGLYDFNAESPQEVSFRAGDVMNLLQQQGDWWTVENQGKTGLIPANYVQMI